ncbi:glycosyltransferase family 2 protein [Streptomyces albidoflavus]|uniref:glycosyltransferase family 2 protein n=1 Tax=Streptomyces albidoflavus TaxID=1886 RepID=UPI0033B2F621
MVKLSVIVPFYNVRQFAPDTLRSLKANARDDVEFLLVDDCSSDGTRDLLERAVEEVPGAVLLPHEVNGGLATARNTGLDAARGTYLTFLDGDDWYAPGYCGQLLDAAERLGTDFVRVDHVQVTGRARQIHRMPHGRREVPLRPLDAILPADRSTSVDYPYAWAGIYHRRLLDSGVLRFRDGLRTAEDRPWIWRLHREAESFAVTSLYGVFYRRGVSSSLTQIGDVRQLDFLRAFDQVVEETAAHEQAAELLPKAIRTYCAVMAHHLESIERFEPAVARTLRAESAAALGRLPQDILRSTLSALGPDRAARLRRVRRHQALRPGTPAAVPATRVHEEAAR